MEEREICKKLVKVMADNFTQEELNSMPDFVDLLSVCDMAHLLRGLMDKKGFITPNVVERVLVAVGSGEYKRWEEKPLDK